MKYEIFGGLLPGVTLTLESGEAVITQSGGMCWMTDGMDMSTGVKGGLKKGLGRMLTGESLFIATYTARRSGAQITMASTMPGEIRAVEIGPGREYIAQKDAFLCGTPGVEIKTKTSGAMGGLFGGEGFFLQRISGSGLAFLELDGSIKEYTLAPGEVMRVDTGHIAMFEASVGYSVERVKGFKNVLFGGEGLFLTTLQGPGKIWLQTMTTAELAGRISSYIPSGNS